MKLWSHVTLRLLLLLYFLFVFYNFLNSSMLFSECFLCLLACYFIFCFLFTPAFCFLFFFSRWIKANAKERSFSAVRVFAIGFFFNMRCAICELFSIACWIIIAELLSSFKRKRRKEWYEFNFVDECNQQFVNQSEYNYFSCLLFLDSTFAFVLSLYWLLVCGTILILQLAKNSLNIKWLYYTMHMIIYLRCVSSMHFFCHSKVFIIFSI